MKQRQVVERTEVIRRAYLFVARNTTLPDSVRARAQMKLHALPRASCPSRINLTCTETGVARGKSQIEVLVLEERQDASRLQVSHAATLLLLLRPIFSN